MAQRLGFKYMRHRGVILTVAMPHPERAQSFDKLSPSTLLRVVSLLNQMVSEVEPHESKDYL